MIEITEKDYLVPPYPYQRDGIRHIISQKYPAVFDDMGVGKTYQAVTATSILFQNNEIDMAIVVCPKSVRSQWDSDETGEIKKYCASDYISVRYDSNFTGTFPINEDQLIWVTVSYSYLRSKLMEFLYLVQRSKKRYILILDESSFVKSHTTQQTKACKELRKSATRCVILNGTPI